MTDPNKRYSLSDLIDVMAALRDPKSGCPWDLEQSFKTIIPYTIEEAYEVADAVDRNDMNALREELGDLLLQSIYHAQMASEAGHFNIHDVIQDITAKMIYRHPHVFGNEKALSANDVDKIWDEKKKAEKKEDDGALSGIAKSLPSLLYASKLTKNAAKVGFEWPNTNGALDKLEEEIHELREAFSQKSFDDQEEELGDILFVLANYSRMNGINPEEALRKACVKFTNRFNGMEKDIKSKYKEMNKASLQEMENNWNKQKLK